MGVCNSMHRRWRLLFLLSVTGAGLSLADDGATPARETVELRAREGLPNFFRKTRGTNLIRVAYFGGSITAADGWRPQSLAWLRARYPAAQFAEVNAAIGGTGSDLGVFRLQRDVLVHRPDLVFVEFAVNDGGAPPAQIHRCMEGIVRQVWKADPATDVCFVYTLHEGMTNDLAAGRLPRSAGAMEQVADHYGIPSIHLALEAARRVRVGEWVFTAPTPEAPADPAKGLPARPAFAPDGCHPFAETGHRLYTEAITRSFEKMENPGRPAPHALGQPFTPDNHENAKMIALDRRFLAGNWEKLEPADSSLARGFANRLPALWQADRAGASLRFSFRGRWAVRLRPARSGRRRTRSDRRWARAHQGAALRCVLHVPPPGHARALLGHQLRRPQRDRQADEHIVRQGGHPAPQRQHDGQA